MLEEYIFCPNKTKFPFQKSFHGLHYNVSLRCDDHFKKAIQIEPNWAEVHFNLGLLYHKEKKVAQAISTYQKFIRLKPELQKEQEIIDEVDHQITPPIFLSVTIVNNPLHHMKRKVNMVSLLKKDKQD